MIEKHKRGNGSSLIGYLKYANHFNKVQLSQSVIDNSSPKVFETVRPGLILNTKRKT